MKVALPRLGLVVATVFLAACAAPATVQRSVDASRDASTTPPPPSPDASADAFKATSFPPSPPAGAPDTAVDADRLADAGQPGTCGMRTSMRGLTSRSLTVAGLKRTYLIYLPPNLDATAPAPFVFVFHGFTMSGQDMFDITQYSALADQEGFGVAFPDGEGGPNSLASPWNVENAGQTVCGLGQDADATGDDFAFIDAMKADVAQDQCLDAAHVFATGFSMGGYFTHHIACYRSDIRAAAPHSGGTIADLSSCTTGHVPIIVFHGTSDSVIADGCDDPAGAAQPGFPPSATMWAAKNGCQSTYSVVATDGDAGGNGQCYLYDGCPADGQVELCTFTGMDHCWAGGDPSGSAGSSSCPTYASATALQWQFFKTYAW